MTVRCPTCGIALRANEEHLGRRSRAKCPKCQGDVPLSRSASPPASTSATAAAGATTFALQCGSCGARLRAPAARAGENSRCPKCHADLILRTEKPGAGSLPVTDHEDSSSAATRRIDSRLLAGGSATRPVETSSGVDLEAFIGAGGPASKPMPVAAGVGERATEPSPAALLMKPAVAAMEKIAVEIREAAEGFAPPVAKRDEPATTKPKAVAATAGLAEPRPLLHPPSAPVPSHRAPALSAPPFPMGRGLLAGSLAGLAVGGLAAALAGGAHEALLAPLPLTGELLGISERLQRMILPALLGAIAGVIASGSGEPTARDRPLTLLRCGGTGLLAGLACGMLTAVIAGTGLQVWPVASWMRDLLLVGLLTPALNRLIPSTRA